MSLFELFFKVLSLYLEAKIQIRIRIKGKGRIRIKVMRIRNTAYNMYRTVSNWQFLIYSKLQSSRT